MHRESIYRRYVPAVDGREQNGSSGYWFIFAANRLLVRQDGERLAIPLCVKPEDLAPALVPVRSQYLGKLMDSPCYSAEVAPDSRAPQNMEFKDLRAIYGSVDEDIFLLAGRAIQIAAWDQTHQYCGRCGKHTETLPEERAAKCPSCGFISYPRLSPAVIVAVLKDDRLLLARYASFRGTMHTVIAGFVEPGETLEECVYREVLEETGIRVKNIRYFSNQPWPFPNSLMIGFTAEYAGGEIKVDGAELAEAAWYAADSIPQVPPKLSIARELIEWFVETHSGNKERIQDGSLSPR